MASMRDIKLKIKSVKSTQQITKAMNLVSAAKLQRAKSKLEVNRPFYQATQRVLSSIVDASKGISHPYFAHREVKTSTTIIIAGDRGLCGGYNINVCKMARQANHSRPNHNYLAVGTRARDYFRRRRKTVIESYGSISEDPNYLDAELIGGKALEMFQKGETDEIWLAYTEFKSIISHKPTMLRLLPVDTEKFSGQEEEGKSQGASVIMRFEPDEESVIDSIVPKYLNTVIYGALLESASCQEGARMTAMDSATDNAQEMIDKYTVNYNRARQGAITQELTEIVSGANALE